MGEFICFCGQKGEVCVTVTDRHGNLVEEAVLCEDHLISIPVK